LIRDITIITFFAFIATYSVFGCDCKGGDNADCAAVFAAEEEITVEERAYTLAADLWVNLMPPVSPDGPDLNVVVKIKATDGEDFPDGYDADNVWLLQGDTIVITEFVEERPRELSGNNVLEKIARTKSKLNPEETVDVVTRIITPDGEKHYLRAPGLTITVTH
jgi:hypothetical protein